jgi:hypothetical protein
MEISRLISQLRIGKFGKSNSRHKSSDNCSHKRVVVILAIRVVVIALFCQILSCHSLSINYHFVLDHLKKQSTNILINLHI